VAAVQALTVASEKIKAARSWADSTLQYLDTTRQVSCPGRKHKEDAADRLQRCMQHMSAAVVPEMTRQHTYCDIMQCP
jgi:hypothetical protein